MTLTECRASLIELSKHLDKETTLAHELIDRASASRIERHVNAARSQFARVSRQYETYRRLRDDLRLLERASVASTGASAGAN